MDRVAKLKALINDRFGGVQAEFARAIKRSPAQVGQWLGRHRKLGDAGARNIELELGIPGYFDSISPSKLKNLQSKIIAFPLNDPIKREVLSLMDNMDERGHHELALFARQCAERYPKKKGHHQ